MIMEMQIYRQFLQENLPLIQWFRAIVLSGVSGMVRSRDLVQRLDAPPNHSGYTAIELNR